MKDILTEALIDAAMDTIRLFPFLLITYVIMEYMESRAGKEPGRLLQKAGKFGPLFASILGIVPQCGFSAAAASLFSGGMITIGTLLAVFLSTSDEMLPIFMSQAVPFPFILKTLLAKAGIGAVTGLGVDAVLRMTGHQPVAHAHIHDLCEHEHCGCEEEHKNILRSAMVHTLHILLFLFVISFIITLLVEAIGKETIASLLTGHPMAGVLIAGIIGLIPNCAASVTITQLYLSGLLSTGQMMAGLLVGAGTGLLVLYRTNRNLVDNIKITGLLYAAGVFWGLMIEWIF